MSPRPGSGDSSAVASTSGSHGETSKRQRRKPVTCAQCRKRKLRCDRGNPCTACKERGEEVCDWGDAIRLPNTTYTREEEAIELKKQLDRLEGLLALLDEPLPAGEQVHVRKDSYSTESDVPPSPGPRPSTRGSVSGSSSPSMEQLVYLLPPQPELDMLAHTFITRELSFLPVFHVPSFRSRYESFNPAYAARSQPFFLALLLAIAGWAGLVSGDRDAKQSSALLDGAMDALNLADYTTRPSLDALRTLLVVHQHRVNRECPSASYIRAAAFQLAQDLGLNRDPAYFHGMSEVEREERRRMWHLLVSWCWTADSGRTLSCHPATFDTRFPANAADVDINPDRVVESPFPSTTPTLYLSYFSQIASIARTITERLYPNHSTSPIAWGSLVDLNADLGSVESTCPSRFALEWRGDLLVPLETTELDTEVMRIRVRLLLLQQYIRLNRPFLTRGFSDLRFREARRKCCSAAHQILSIFRSFPNNHSISTGWDLTFHALNALLILAIDLLQDPQGANSEGARRQISSTLAILTSRRYSQSSVAETIQVVNVLLGHSLSTTKRKHDALAASGAFGPQTSSLRGAVPPGPSDGYRPRSSGSDAHRPNSSSGLPPLTASTTFNAPLPVPMSVDPLVVFDYRAQPESSESLPGLWKGLLGFQRFYAVPDAREWEELSKGVSAWAGGIDILDS